MRHQKNTSIMKTGFLIACITVIAKLIGFLREMIIANYYGTTSETDAFFFAQSIPGMIFPSVCMSISTAFISLYVEKKLNDSDKADRFASGSLKCTVFIALLLSLLGIFILPYIVPLLAPGFKNNQLVLAVRLSQMAMAAFVFLMIQYMFIAILNANNIFYITQISAVANNIVVVALIALLSRQHTIYGLMIIVIAAQMVQLLVLGVPVFRSVHIRWKVPGFDAETRLLLKMSVPLMVGNSVLAIHTIIDKAIASSLENGAISALSYADTINQLVSGVFITSLSTVLHPNLTENAVQGKESEFFDNIKKSNTYLFLAVGLVSVFLIVIPDEIISFLFERGDFDRNSTFLTARALRFYAIGYVFICVREVFSRAFYAVKNTKTPMLNSIIGIAINCAASLILARYVGIIGIALGTSISNIVIAGLMFLSMKKNFVKAKLIDWSGTLKVVLAMLVSGLAVYFMHGFLADIASIIRILLMGIAGAAAYAVVLLLLRMDEVVSMVKLVVNRLKR